MEFYQKKIGGNKSNMNNNVNLSPARSFLIANEKVDGAYVHGSVLTEYFREDSDIDIALFLKPGTEMSNMETLGLAAKLSVLLKREVHLGLVLNKFLVFAKEVIANGQPLFIKDKNNHDLYVATLMSMYAEQKERQREIFHAYTN